MLFQLRVTVLGLLEWLLPIPGIKLCIYFYLCIALGLHQNEAHERQGLNLSHLCFLGICLIGELMSEIQGVGIVVLAFGKSQKIK